MELDIKYKEEKEPFEQKYMSEKSRKFVVLCKYDVGFVISSFV